MHGRNLTKDSLIYWLWTRNESLDYLLNNLRILILKLLTRMENISVKITFQLSVSVAHLYWISSVGSPVYLDKCTSTGFPREKNLSVSGALGLNFAHSHEWNRRDCFLSWMNTKYWRGTCKTPLKGADQVAHCFTVKILLYPTILHYTMLYYRLCGLGYSNCFT